LTLLKEYGVGASVYYPQPVPHFTYYKEKYGYKDNTFPVAKMIGDTSIALPIGPHLNDDDMAYISQTLKNVLQKLK